MDSQSQAQLRARIDAALGHAFEDLVVLLKEIHSRHKQLDESAELRDSVALTVDVFLDRLELPWGAPKAILRPALVSALADALQSKTS
jgi:hypothetical protein